MLPILMLLLIILSTTIQPSKGWYQCNTGNNYTQGSPIIQNLQHVPGVLPNETASSNKGYRTIVYGQSPNTVYAMAMCRGDQTETQCRDCLQDPTASLQRLCGLMPGGRVMAKECFVRWENASFSTTPDLNWRFLENVNDAFNTTANSLTARGLLVKLIGEALRSSNTKRYATGKAEVDSIHNIFGQVQCWGDISDDDCKSCFAGGVDKIGTKEGAIAFTGNCYAEYENHIFFVPPAAPALAPAPAPLNGLLPPSISHNKKPEYAMHGELSAKADVYSFGILVLEITSGRPIIKVSSNSEEYLLGWAWKLYSSGKLHSIVDKDIKEAHNNEQILRYSHVGLLCTQADPSLRPIMSEIMMILSSNSVTLPNPTTPAFISTTINSTF